MAEIRTKLLHNDRLLKNHEKSPIDENEYPKLKKARCFSLSDVKSDLP